MFSRQEHVSDGTLLTLDMVIGYIKRSDISVTLDGVLTNAWSWIPGQNTIRFDYAIPSYRPLAVLLAFGTVSACSAPPVANPWP